MPILSRKEQQIKFVFGKDEWFALNTIIYNKKNTKMSALESSEREDALC